MRVAVLMLNLGGPASLAEVRPFLKNLFADREIIRFPGGALGQKVFSSLLARRKAPSSAQNYAAIGGRSPLVDWTTRQGEGMRVLVEAEADVELLIQPCMRYWHPMAEAALRAAQAFGAEHIVAFKQYPQYSTTTTGGSLRDLLRTAGRLGVTTPITAIERWHEHDPYVAAVAECVREGLSQVPAELRTGTRIVYSAHSLPMKFVDAGDPYPDQIRRTTELVHARTGLANAFEIAWQSKVGPVRWLQPSSIDRIRALPGEGARDVVVVPIAFVNDHIETLQELDRELRHAAETAGMRTFVRAPSLNVRPAFLRAIADLLLDHLQTVGVRRRPTARSAPCIAP